MSSEKVWDAEGMRAACLLACLAAWVRAQDGGSIGGAVTDASAHVPVANVRVSVTASGGKSSAVFQATTDANGNFVVSGLDPGDYVATFEIEGFVRAASRPVHVEQGKVRLNMEILAAASVRGRVLDTEAQPAANVS